MTTGYAEVKSTTDAKAFKKSCVKPHQIGFARRQSAACGAYWFFIHRLTTNTWYWVPANFLLTRFDKSSSIPWGELEVYKWSAINA
jgi:penicillin-binding protein-related factor A (putative recombinase)